MDMASERLGLSASLVMYLVPSLFQELVLALPFTLVSSLVSVSG